MRPKLPSLLDVFTGSAHVVQQLPLVFHRSHFPVGIRFFGLFVDQHGDAMARRRMITCQPIQDATLATQDYFRHG